MPDSLTIQATQAAPAAAPPAQRSDPAVLLAHQAMQSLLQTRTSPTPSSYAAWYAYHAGTPAELRAAMDERLARQGVLSPSDLAELQALHGAEDPQTASLAEVSRQLEAALAEVTSLVRGAGDDAARYGDRLEEFGRQAQPALGEAISRLLADTEELCRKSRAVARRLDERAREAATLRAALREAREAASTDALTGLANRRGFEAALAEEGAAADASGAPASLLVLDVDHFKRVNDAHGHPFGDVVLRGVARSLQDSLRPSDRAGRLGGEEFALLLPRTDRAGALHLADRLRRTIAAERFLPEAGGEAVRVTISGGVAERVPGESPDRLLARADAALYTAKRSGRDRIIPAD